MVAALPDNGLISEAKETNSYLDYILRNGVNVYICEDDEDEEDRADDSETV